MMKVPSKLILLALAACWMFPGSSSALPPTESAVDRIPLLDNSSTWRALDDRHLVLSLSPKQRYLLTLDRDCLGLVFASHLGVSASNNTVYAGFDYITADGQHCTIKAIERLSDPV